MRSPQQSLALAFARALAALALAAGVAAAQGEAAAPAYDLIISGGRIVDGSGAAWFYGDVAVASGRIAAVTPRGALDSATALRRVDATGLVVAPGFIDIQGHSGFYFLQGDSRVIAKVSQGVTTEILGEGNTPAPLHPRRAARQGAANADSLTRRFAEPRGFAHWLTAMEARGISVNVGSFVGGSTLRAYGMAQRAGRAGPEALAEMQGALVRAMEDGAFGFATALIYPPGVFADTDELIVLARAMRPYGGLYISHIRSEGDQLLEAVDEAIRIGRESGVPVEIYHLKAGGPRNWAKGPESIARIDSARALGIDVQANMYPYPAGGTGLTSCLPPAAQEDDRLFARLDDATERARIRAEIERPTSSWENLCELAGPASVLIARLGTDSLRRYSGMRLAEIAAARGTDWIETAMMLIRVERSRVETIYFLMSEENVALNLRQPWMKIGTDAGGPNPEGAQGLVHPRAYGTFPRILGRYVREQGVLPLEEAVRKMTSATARRLGITDRGLLTVGMHADIVLFDPAAIIDRATFERPHQLSEGVAATYVNGVAVWEAGRHTGAKPGRAVRGPGARNNAP
jgi:dihydroorotase/N-acyl-D-amino-acid deacylase